MKNYKVIVTCVKYDSPSLYVSANSKIEAVNLAMNKSGLSRFSNWIFIPIEL